MENVTSSNETKSRDEEEFLAGVVEDVIVRYLLPSVIIIGNALRHAIFF